MHLDHLHISEFVEHGTSGEPGCASAYKRQKDASYRRIATRLRQVRRRQGQYLLRTNLTEQDPNF